MKYAVNESAPIPLSVPQSQYLYGTNEYVPIVESREGQEMNIHDVMRIVRHPQLKVSLQSGRKVDYIPARKIVVPVNKENVLRSGILSEEFADEIPESITLTIPKGKDFITKPELFLLDLLDGYDWSRPLNMLNMGGDINIGIKDYLMYEGYSYKFVPLRNKPATLDPGKVDLDALYRRMTEVYRFDALGRTDYFVDYQNMYTHLGVMSVRQLHCTAAKAFLKAGQNERALEMLEQCERVMQAYPMESIPVGFTSNDYMVVSMVQMYYTLGQKQKADDLALKMSVELLQSAAFYVQYYEWGKTECEDCLSYLYYLSDVVRAAGNTELADVLDAQIKDVYGFTED